MLTLLLVPSSVADDASPSPSSAATGVPADLARRIGEITDAVLEYHIDPPARQQMILGGIKACTERPDSPVPAGLSRKVSSVATPEQLAELLVEVWPKSTAKPTSGAGPRGGDLDGLLASVSGGGYLISAKDRKVAEQVEGNRYVGIHIAWAWTTGKAAQKCTRSSREGPPIERGPRPAT